MRLVSCAVALLISHNLSASAGDLSAVGTVGSLDDYPHSTTHLSLGKIAELADAAAETPLSADFLAEVTRYHNAMMEDAALLREISTDTDTDQLRKERTIHINAMEVYNQYKSNGKISGFADVGFEFGSAVYKFDTLYGLNLAYRSLPAPAYGHEHVRLAYSRIINRGSMDGLQLIYTAKVPEFLQPYLEGSVCYDSAKHTYTFPHAGYVYGGWEQPFGRDCSSIIATIMNCQHFSTYHMVRAYEGRSDFSDFDAKVTPVETADIEIGDILVFSKNGRGGHTGIFMGWEDSTRSTVYLGDLNRTDALYEDGNPTTYGEKCGIGFGRRAFLTEGVDTLALRVTETS